VSLATDGATGLGDRAHAQRPHPARLTGPGRGGFPPGSLVSTRERARPSPHQPPSTSYRPRVHLGSSKKETWGPEASAEAQPGPGSARCRLHQRRFTRHHPGLHYVRTPDAFKPTSALQAPLGPFCYPILDAHHGQQLKGLRDRKIPKKHERTTRLLESGPQSSGPTGFERGVRNLPTWIFCVPSSRRGVAEGGPPMGVGRCRSFNGACCGASDYWIGPGRGKPGFGISLSESPSVLTARRSLLGLYDGCFARGEGCSKDG